MVMKVAKVTKKEPFTCAVRNNETIGYLLGQAALDFVCDLGQRLHQITGEPRSKQYLLQRLSIAIQRGNAAAVLGTARVGERDPFWE